MSRKTNKEPPGNVEIFRTDPVLFQFTNWPREGPVHAFTSRLSGGTEPGEIDMVYHYGADEETVRISQKTVLESIKTTGSSFYRAEQIHSSNVGWVEDKSTEDGTTYHENIIPGVDGILSRTPGNILLAYGADCPLVFLFAIDSSPAVAGIVHASWKGIKGGIVEKALEKLLESVGVAAQNVYSFIGPSIHSCCYEVKDDFRRKMMGERPETTSCFQTRNERMYFDLQQAIVLQSKRHLPEENIADSNTCNFCHSEYFYSYRREGADTGRMAGLIEVPG